MSATKRLKAAWAALTQPAHTFTCTCGDTALVIGTHPPDFAGLLCSACEQKSMDQWLGDFYNRHLMELPDRTKGAA